MPLLDEALTYVLSATTAFQEGSSTGAKVPIFLSMLPSERPDVAVSFHEPGGAPPLATLNGSTPMMERPRLQVISRAPTYAAARANAQTIWDAFFLVKNSPVAKTGSTGTTDWLMAEPISSPTDMGDDSKDRSRVSCNFQLSKEMS